MRLEFLLSVASIYLAFVGLGLIFAPQRLRRRRHSHRPLRRADCLSAAFRQPFPGDCGP